MSPNILIEYFHETKSFHQCKELYTNLLGLYFEIRRIDGTRLNLSAVKKSPHTLAARQQPKLNCKCQYHPQGCFHLTQEIIEHTVTTASPQVLICKGGLRQILLPLILRKQVSGLLLIGENDKYRLNYAQIQCIIKIMQKEIDFIDKNELTFFKDFEGKNLTPQQQTINKVLTYLDEHYHLPELSLQEVSRKNGVSYFYLSRLFKKEVKKSFPEYLNDLRVKVASRMLKDSRMTISQVSYSCGFDDPGYFCKVFKKTFEQSPIDYRRRISSQPKTTKRF